MRRRRGAALGKCGRCRRAGRQPSSTRMRHGRDWRKAYVARMKPTAFYRVLNMLMKAPSSRPRLPNGRL